MAKTKMPNWAGLVSYHRARSTGTQVGVYKANEAGMEDDPATPWATVCEPHAGVVCHTTRADAMAAAPYPNQWCPTCQEEPPADTSGGA
jgi:hypothetical protein